MCRTAGLKLLFLHPIGISVLFLPLSGILLASKRYPHASSVVNSFIFWLLQRIEATATWRMCTEWNSNHQGFCNVMQLKYHSYTKNYFCDQWAMMCFLLIENRAVIASHASRPLACSKETSELDDILTPFVEFLIVLKSSIAHNSKGAFYKPFAMRTRRHLFVTKLCRSVHYDGVILITWT